MLLNSSHDNAPTTISLKVFDDRGSEALDLLDAHVKLYSLSAHPGTGDVRRVPLSIIVVSQLF
jgi:hypothetical protein